MRKAGILFLLTLLVSMFAAGRAFAAGKANVTVYPFTGDGIPAAELKSLTLAFEESLSRFDSLELIEQSKREKVLKFLDPSLLTCVDLDCLLRAGKALSADVIVLGTVSRAGSQYILTAKMFNVATGKSLLSESAGSPSITELGSATGLLASVFFGTASSGASDRAQAEADRLQNEQRLKALESLAANLRANIAEINREGAKVRMWGWVLAGVGAASAGLAGTCYYLAEQAYENFKTTTDDDLAAEYRAQVTMWDTLTLVSAGAGVVSFGFSIPFFVRGPSSQAEKQELKRIETEISALQSAQGETR